MATTPRYRHVEFGIKGVEVWQRDGYTYARTPTPLKPYPQRLSDKLLYWAETAGDRTYIAQRDESNQWRHVSYRQALDYARRIGQALINRQLDTERPVIIISGNDIEHALLALGCQMAGVPYASISAAYSLVSQDFEKLRHVVDTLTPGLVFASDAQPFLAAVKATIPDTTEFVVTRGANDARVNATFQSLLDTVPTEEVDAAREATNADTIVKFLFTSGSTSLPKAVINTNRMLCSNLQMIQQAWPFLAEEPPVLVDWLPWNHTFGGNHNLGIALYNGGTIYIDDGRPTNDGIATTLQNLREISPTIYFNVPVGWERIADALQHDEVLRESYYKRLRLQFYAGAALSQPVWDKLHATAERAIGERIVMNTGLGMTETSPSATFVLKEAAQAGHLGIPLPGMEVKLAPVGDKIEIRYRGPNLTPGYWRDPAKTAEALDEEGFFRSGDAVLWIDENNPDEGFVFDGRVAEDFKLNTGTWVNVGPLRTAAAREGAPYIQDSVITGHDRRELGIIIIPNVVRCRQLSQLGDQASNEDVLHSEPVRAFFQAFVDRMYERGTGSSTRITRAVILTDPPSLDHGEITDKGSINQSAVLKHRAHLVQALYEGSDPHIIRPTAL